MADVQQPSGVSRRKAIMTGAGLVAAGAVVGVTGGLVTTRVAEGGSLPGAPKENLKVPVMVHLRDATAGKFDVFVNDTLVEVVDPGFAAKLVQAAASTA